MSLTSNIDPIAIETFPAGNDPRLPQGTMTFTDSISGDGSFGSHIMTCRIFVSTHPNAAIGFQVIQASAQYGDANGGSVRIRPEGFVLNPFNLAGTPYSNNRAIETVAVSGLSRSPGVVRDSDHFSPWFLGYPKNGTAVNVIFEFTNLILSHSIGLGLQFWLEEAAYLPGGPSTDPTGIAEQQGANYGTGQDAYYAELRRGDVPKVKLPANIPPGKVVQANRLLAAVNRTNQSRRQAQTVGIRQSASNIEIVKAVLTSEARVGGSLTTATARVLGQSPQQVLLQLSKGKKLAPGAAYANLTGRFEEGNGGI